MGLANLGSMQLPRGAQKWKKRRNGSGVYVADVSFHDSEGQRKGEQDRKERGPMIYRLNRINLLKGLKPGGELWGGKEKKGSM